MKKIIGNFKKGIRFIVTIVASREFAFVYALLGIFSQIAHTYFLTSSISSFAGGFRIFQAVLLSTFISGALLYFVSIVDNSDTKENKRNRLALNIFMTIEILINLYYYSRHLIIDAQKIQIFDFIFAVLISGFIPITIKLFGSHIRSKEWAEELLVKKSENQDSLFDIDKIIDEKLKEIITSGIVLPGFSQNLLDEEKFNELFKIKAEDFKNSMLENLDGDVEEIFAKNQALFLTQFENKIKLLMQQAKDPK